MTMNIEVTQDDIDNGIADDCYNCPVALAAGRATGSQRVLVSVCGYGHNSIEIAGILYDAPPSVVEFVKKFDGGFDVQPFNFSIDVE